MSTIDDHMLNSFQVSPQSAAKAISRPEANESLANRQENDAEARPAKAFHRIREVRLQQGVSLRSVARNTGIDVRTLRNQEEPTTDLPLSVVRLWQRALDVPLADLLEEDDAPLSRPVMERARMLRLMKTATAIEERCESEGIRRMAKMLIEQLTEVMPELRDVSPWHNYGQRRGLDEMGRIFDQRVSDEQMRDD